MSDDLHYEIEQARAEWAKVGRSSTIDVHLAGNYLNAAIASRDGTERKEWDSLFGFWRTLIKGGWPCPECGGQMETGEHSGVRCKNWNCTWAPGKR
jgi:hypothetical protein